MIVAGRRTHEATNVRELTVFVIGVRINNWMRPDGWLPTFRAMPRMLLVHRRPAQGHVRLGWRERIPGRGGGRPPAPRRGERSRRGGRGRRPVGGGRAGLLVCRPGTHPDDSELEDFLVTRLAKYKVPAHIVYVPELPRTASGKVRKADLRSRPLPLETR